MERVRIRRARVREGEIELQYGEEYIPVDDITPLCAQKVDSDGYVLMGLNEVLYLANTQTDLKMVIEKLTASLDEVIAIASSQYVTAAQGAVLTKPFASQAQSLRNIKDELDNMELI